MEKLFAKKSFLSSNRKILGAILLPLFLVMVLSFSIRGLPGNPTAKDLNNVSWKDNGPLELSPERGRFALMYSIAEDKSFHFSTDLARFTTPDLAYSNGNYVSLFAPTVSFFAIPGYFVGKALGISQVGSFAMIAIFAILNVYLIRAIAMRMGAHSIAATIGGITFLFASPAFSYAVTLYQHHISTFLLLMSIYLLMRFKSNWALFGVWTMFALSFSVDYPNLFMFIPIMIYTAIRTIPVVKRDMKFHVRIPLVRIVAAVGVILPMLFFVWFNTESYGNPLQLSGTLERAVEVKADGKPILESEVILQRIKELKITAEELQNAKSNFFAFFQNRNMLNGFYIHLISPDRGIIMYTPVILLGLIGLIIAYRQKNPYTALFIGIIGVNLLLYSMWDDPYGGWAFGSRYLIPSYAVLAIFIAIAIHKLGRNNLFIILFFILFSYSSAVNTLGAITTNRLPPKVEAQALSEISKRQEPYTYQRNIDYLNVGNSKAFVYQWYAGYYMSAWQYYTYLTTLIILVGAGLIILYRASISEDRKIQGKAMIKPATIHGGTK